LLVRTSDIPRADHAFRRNLRGQRPLTREHAWKRNHRSIAVLEGCSGAVGNIDLRRCLRPNRRCIEFDWSAGRGWRQRTRRQTPSHRQWILGPAQLSTHHNQQDNRYRKPHVFPRQHRRNLLVTLQQTPNTRAGSTHPRSHTRSRHLLTGPRPNASQAVEIGLHILL